jgi:hypothetical protein
MRFPRSLPPAGAALALASLLIATASAAAVNFTVRWIDPEDDVHESASSGMGDAAEGQLVAGHESIDIIRVTSVESGGILTLTMDLAGGADRANFYAFAVQTTSAGRLWNDRDAVAILTNGSAALYLSDNATPHDIDKARRLDATIGANLETKVARLALNLAVLGAIEHYHVQGFAFKTRVVQGNVSGYYFDSTRNSQPLAADFWSGFFSSWGTMLLLMVSIFVFFLLFRYKESLNRKAASRPCRSCKKPVSRGLIFCPHCGKENDDKVQ